MPNPSPLVEFRVGNFRNILIVTFVFRNKILLRYTNCLMLQKFTDVRYTIVNFSALECYRVYHTLFPV